MKESDFVRSFHDKLKGRYKDAAWFYKIPTGTFGGARPFDAVCALAYSDGFVVHYALEFKVERDTRLTLERLKEDSERKHQYWSLLVASPFFVTGYVIYRTREKDVVFLPVARTDGERESFSGRFGLIDVWRKPCPA